MDWTGVGWAFGLCLLLFVVPVVRRTVEKVNVSFQIIPLYMICNLFSNKRCILDKNTFKERYTLKRNYSDTFRGTLFKVGLVAVFLHLPASFRVPHADTFGPV